MRRILDLAGWDIRVAPPGPNDWIGVWGRSPRSYRGRWMAEARSRPLLTVEDAFLRSVLPGRSGEPTMGLLLDRTGFHADASAPSDLETLLSTHPLDDPDLLASADNAMARIDHWSLSKYAAVDPMLPIPEPGYVLVIDQTAGDAALPHNAAALFRKMLGDAQLAYPGHPVLVRSHPEATAGYRPGLLQPDMLEAGCAIAEPLLATGALMHGAVAIYTISSTLGFEAIQLGHRPHVYGTPFYAGWGLSDDRIAIPRRTRKLDRRQLFAGAMIIAPTWYDPFRDELTSLDAVIDNLAARATAWRQDRRGWIITNMSAWKRPHLRKMFGHWAPAICRSRRRDAEALAQRTGKPLMVWANGAVQDGSAVTRIEDGFLRSAGLGATLVPPSSLVLDDLGIHFDPSRESRLERLIAESLELPLAEIQRSERLIEAIRAKRITKYNIAGSLPELPNRRPILLVAAQVEDDAAVLRSRPDPMTNAELLSAARQAHPDATIVYKPHPDVEAGLRRGRVPDARSIADVVAEKASPTALLDRVDRLWTQSSTLGFEALLRGVPVTCLGAPFYAGWGLTEDLGPVPARRIARPSLAMLVHAALIGYPRYFDPVTGEPCPPEVAVERLARGLSFPPPGLLSRLQRLSTYIR